MKCQGQLQYNISIKFVKEVPKVISIIFDEQYFIVTCHAVIWKVCVLKSTKGCYLVLCFIPIMLKLITQVYYIVADNALGIPYMLMFLVVQSE